jgi:hypothetical protein
MSNVKLIRMSSGEDVVAEIESEDSDTIKIKNAIVAIPTGSGQLGFAPWSPILSKEEKNINVAKRFVVYQAEPDSSVVEQYNTMFGNVIAPKKQSIIV